MKHVKEDRTVIDSIEAFFKSEGQDASTKETEEKYKKKEITCDLCQGKNDIENYERTDLKICVECRDSLVGVKENKEMPERASYHVAGRKCFISRKPGEQVCLFCLYFKLIDYKVSRN